MIRMLRIGSEDTCKNILAVLAASGIGSWDAKWICCNCLMSWFGGALCFSARTATIGIGARRALWDRQFLISPIVNSRWICLLLFYVLKILPQADIALGGHVSLPSMWSLLHIIEDLIHMALVHPLQSRSICLALVNFVGQCLDVLGLIFMDSRRSFLLAQYLLGAALFLKCLKVLAFSIWLVLTALCRNLSSILIVKT